MPTAPHADSVEGPARPIRHGEPRKKRHDATILWQHRPLRLAQVCKERLPPEVWERKKEYSCHPHSPDLKDPPTTMAVDMDCIIPYHHTPSPKPSISIPFLHSPLTHFPFYASPLCNIAPTTAALPAFPFPPSPSKASHDLNRRFGRPVRCKGHSRRQQRQQSNHGYTGRKVARVRRGSTGKRASEPQISPEHSSSLVANRLLGRDGES